MDNAAFGKRVERMRTRRRLSLPDLVERTGLSYQSLWRIERGQQGEPGLFTAAKIANALGCSLDYLAGLVGSFLPFARTRADREASSDPRPSIAELYSTKEVYLDRVRNAAEALVTQRFVRREDMEAMLEDSARYWDFLMPPSPK